MNLKIAVLEDKESDYLMLESALIQWSENTGNRMEIRWYQTGNEMMRAFGQDDFDILFSDIELEENGNDTGLTFCGRLREQGYSGEIIFLTAFREYVFQGYDVRAFHYLLKPITQETLRGCMDKYLAIHADDFYYFHKENDIIKIRYCDIIFIHKEKHDAVIQLKNLAYAERVSLGEMEKRLPPQFVRCHRSYIINIIYVDSIIGNLIYMANGTKIVASRNHLPTVRRELLAFAQN